MTVAGQDVSRTTPHRLLLDEQTFATYLTYGGPRLDETVDVSIQLTAEGTPAVFDLMTGAERTAAAARCRDPDDAPLRAPLTGGPMFIDFNRGAVDVYGERSEVTAARNLTVAEVIARHQARQRMQDAIVKNYIARARTAQHFRPTPADPGYDVVTENRYFVAGSEVEWEELSFSVNGSRWGADRPPFPLLQPEKVLSLPLQLRFDEGYRYRLDGRPNGWPATTATWCASSRCATTTAALYRGTVWIDERTFARIRVQAVQGGLSGAGGVQRRDPAILAADDGRRPTGVPAERDDREADHADRRAQSPGREERDLRGRSRQRGRSSRASGSRRERATG